MEDNITVFEDHPLEYEDWFERHKFTYESELEALRRLTPRKGEGIEIGAGTGRYGLPLGITKGVEPSFSMGDVAKERGMDVVCGIAEALPLARKKFDYALIVTICYLLDPEMAFREASRILKPGGGLIVGFIDGQSDLGKYYEHKKQSKSLFYKDAQFYSAEQVMDFLSAQGFEDFHFLQTLFGKDLHQVTVEAPIEGFGRGSFVVVKAYKRENRELWI